MATFADGLDLLDIVRNLQEAGGALKTTVSTAEVEAEPVGHYWDIQLNSNKHELVGLGGSEELRLVDQDTLDVAVVLADSVIEVSATVKTEIRLALGPDAGVELGAVFGIG